MQAADLTNNPFPQASVEYGRVLADENGEYLVETNFGRAAAVKAFSCLVRPVDGDRVLVSLASSGPGHILAVVERAEVGRQTDLELTGPVKFQVRSGDLTVNADQDLILGCGRELSLASSKMTCQAEEAEATFLSLSFIGRVFSGQLERLSVAAETVENVFSRLTQRLKNVCRFVKDHEEVQTGSTRILVEDAITIHSKNALHMAEEIVTINAGQIHLG